MALLENDTICAIATAPGGALGIIRVSGPRTIDIVGKIFHSATRKSLSAMPGYTLAYGSIRDDAGKVVDSVVLSLFRSPHSFTGEDSIELTCHSSNYILQRVMEMLMQNGCRTARAGEFTERAFINGKMDLTQAEAVADLIASRSAAQHSLAINQMRGAVKNGLNELREQLLHLLSLIELELDFSDHEDLEFASRKELVDLAQQLKSSIAHILNTFKLGNALRNGINICITGLPNAGKSTLLNALLQDERAIVSDTPGTTRDVVSEYVQLNGVLYRLLDTAGLRHAHDGVEKIGVERGLEQVAKSDIVFAIVDSAAAADDWKSLQALITPKMNSQPLLLLVNKSESLTKEKKERLCNDLGLSKANILFIAAKFNDPSPQINQWLNHTVNNALANAGSIVLSNVRHQQCLLQAQDAIERVLCGLKSGLSNDLISEDLRVCATHIGEITGQEISSQAVINNIFSHFCIGK